jgi:DNA polymerase
MRAGRDTAATRAAAVARPDIARAVRPDIARADWGQLQEAVRACQACPLCASRHQTVFGMGAEPPQSSDTEGVGLMIVGEAPGEHEDLQGLPFVGAAGQLLDQMLSALGGSRHEDGGRLGRVYLANVLKCRPPGNRNPQAEEVAQCLPFLRRQIELLRPRLLLAMGRFGAQALLAEQMPDVAQTPLGQLRGRSYSYEGIPLVVTYHPAYLLRNPAEKGKVWADLCLAQSLQAGPKMGA